MSGIANLTTKEFQEKINRFSQKYVNDWSNWLNVPPDCRPAKFGKILRKWQACRPNRMRRTRLENLHDTPYLEDLIDQASPFITLLLNFDIRLDASFTKQNCDALKELWNIFENLSYSGKARGGLAGIVGISKAVLLLTDGRVGPAFDSKVRSHLEIGNITNHKGWIDALYVASEDIRNFEDNNGITLKKAALEQYAFLNNGRIYDMALGPS